MSNSFATPWTAAHQATLFMGFFRQEYWSGLLSPSPGDLPDPGVQSASLALQVDSLSLNHQGSLEMSMKLNEVKVTQSCLILCNSIDYTVHGILQARILEWVAFPFSRRSS